MKRADLIKEVEARARRKGLDCHLHRQGGSHEVWKVNDKSVPIPRHREVNDYTAKQILKQVDEALG